MRTSRYVALFFILILAGVAVAEDIEHYFRFTISQKSELDRLTRVISIDNVVRDTVYAYANETQWETFQTLGIPANELPHPSSLYEHKMSASPFGVLDWDSYPTYQAYLAMMRQYATNYPNLCRLDTIGFSIQNRLILALKISDNVNAREDEPQFLYTSSMHGDELVGYILLLRLADHLLTNYGQPTSEGVRATKLVNSMEIWINPLFNPDGTYRLGGDTTVSRATRGNANGIDLNRNFPDRINDTSNTTTGRQTETQVMMRWTWKHNFTLSANFHGGAQVANYPWDNGTPSGTYSMCPDDAWFIHLSRAYATPNPDLMSGGFANGITNGCAWYAVFGGRQDWMYWWNGGREVTIELYNTKTPAGSLLPQRWTNNKESFLAYMEETLKGIRGIVTDAVTHQPLKARIDVLGLSNVPVFTDSTVGDYHRLLLPGTYTLVVSAAGHRPDTLRNITVIDSVATRVDVALQPIGTPISHEPSMIPAKASLFQNYPNPFNPTTTIRYSLPSQSINNAQGRAGVGSQVTLKVHDVLGREVATLINEVKQPGTYTLQFDASRLSSGIYFYQLRAEGFVETKKLILMK